MDLVKQISISCDLNMEGIESQADISSLYVGMQHGVTTDQLLYFHLNRDPNSFLSEPVEP